ncbi:hypothetical protein [Polaromonas sp.]|uniref:hypothetical protein n=1 Tax=Polaromonas sp. TaxID=1869339 RepID=UPI00286AECE1|nr:hypothetical protein [Polaromonas sp.]
MDRVIEEGAARYKSAQEEGQRLIHQRWAALLGSTREALIGSGFYSDRGERLEVEYATGNAPQDDCERLAVEGVKVPAVAFDLAEMLRCRIQECGRRGAVPHYSDSIARE